jgi:hypothetical protein
VGRGRREHDPRDSGALTHDCTADSADTGLPHSATLANAGRARVCHDGGMHTRSKSRLVFALASVLLPLSGTAATFDDDFTGATMRVDLQHVATTSGESAAAVTIRDDGPWPGSRTHLIDTLDRGDYRFSVRDEETGRTLYTGGFNSGFSAKTEPATLETLRFPLPRNAVIVTLVRREAGSESVWRGRIDPSDPNIDRSPAPSSHAHVLVEHGPPATQLDIAILGDGYQAREEEAFDAAAKRAADYLLSVEPFRGLAGKITIRTVFVASEESGITSPLDGAHRRTAFGTTYNSHGSERRLAVRDLARLRDAAASVPYDALIVLANSTRYGGVGLYNNYDAVTINNMSWPYLVVHEFAHNLAGLEDEYFTRATCSRGQKPEPWAPNVTAHPSRARLKWRTLVAPTTPLPTPWKKDAYATFDTAFAKTYYALRQNHASEEEVDALIRRTLPEAGARLAEEPYHDTVGAFEGAANEACGLYRPETDCTMFTLRPDHFCAVCRAAISDAIRMFAE